MKEQTPEGYETEVNVNLQFNTEAGRYDSALEIELDKHKAERLQWVIALKSENKVKEL